jgi:hypothetical protein
MKKEQWGTAMRRPSSATLAGSLFKTSGAIAILLLAGSAWAGSACEVPRDVAALRTAALQQYLMVAALTCHDISAYNGFVRSHQGELQESDRTLLDHFVRRNARTGDGDYNAYKTWLANASSIRSLHDPQFCRIADDAFDAARDRSKPLAELVREQPVPLDVGVCGRDASDERQAALDDQ